MKLKIYKTKMLTKTKRKQWNLTEGKKGKLRNFRQLKHSNQFKHCEIRSHKSLNGNKAAEASFR